MGTLQDRLNVEVTSLIAEAGFATISGIAKEAYTCLQKEITGSEVVTAAAQARSVADGLWIARAPITIKMRLFCLPYAGGVSNNVFGR